MFLSDPFICGHSPFRTNCQNQLTLTSIWGPKSPLHERVGTQDLLLLSFFRKLLCQVDRHLIPISARELFSSAAGTWNNITL